MFHCKDLMLLPSLAKATLIAGHGGISNTIRWVYKPEDMNFAKWVRGNELLIISVPVIQSAGFDLMKLLHKAVRLHMAGMLLLVGEKYIKSIPPDIISYANKNRFPIFSIPGDTPLIDIFEEIGHAIAYDDESSAGDGGLFTDIALGNAIDPGVFTEKCTEYGYDANGPQRMFLLRLASPAMIQTYDYEHLLDNIKKCFETAKLPALLSRFGNNYIGCFSPQDGFYEICRGVLKEASECSPGWNACMGIGAQCTVSGLAGSYREAAECVKILEKLNGGRGIFRYEETGLYRIFLECGDRRLTEEFIGQTLGAILAYDAENGTDFLRTLKSYLRNNGSLLHASDELHMHRNTVRYRIGKMEALTGQSFEDASVRLSFMNAILCLELCR